MLLPTIQPWHRCPNHSPSLRSTSCRAWWHQHVLRRGQTFAYFPNGSQANENTVSLFLINFATYTICSIKMTNCRYFISYGYKNEIPADWLQDVHKYCKTWVIVNHCLLILLGTFLFAENKANTELITWNQTQTKPAIRWLKHLPEPRPKTCLHNEIQFHNFPAVIILIQIPSESSHWDKR